MVVDEEGKNRTNKTTLKSAWRSALKKRLTEPALLEMSGNRVNQDLATGCGLRLSLAKTTMTVKEPYKPETFWEKIVFRSFFALGFLGIFAVLWWFVRQR